ncbi:hypothetical protein V9T40_008882 [Parthenolecanium corni]|uniref:Uncharacterized protein n=1 Tax=Parthenolecanium corni TaxID=536013 RepID=A0AAN9TRA1_9HEMI
MDTDADDTDETTPGPRRPESGHSLHNQRSPTRDSAEILEDADEFSTGVTRDMVEVLEHKQHEESGGVDDAEGVYEAIEAGSDACTMLEECRAEIEAEKAAAAAAVSDEEDTTTPAAADINPAAATANPVATPGDVCPQFCGDRAESPSSGYSFQNAIAGGFQLAKKKIATKCKGKYATLEKYTSLWGSTKAVSAHKKLELEMKKKRKHLELLHERNRKRREKERLRAKEKRRMLRCRDQAKIPQLTDNISVNKAFYFRFNYNKQLPFMPSAMDEHFKKYKKPPFKHYHKGSRPCHKHVDEFEKLRVTDSKTGRGVATQLPIKTKA